MAIERIMLLYCLILRVMLLPRLVFMLTIFIAGMQVFGLITLLMFKIQFLIIFFHAENVTIAEGISLPKAEIICEPLLCSVFELNNTDSRLMSLAYQVYLAHAAYYNATGQYRAFSEGATLANGWEYGWVVLPDGRTWTLDESNSNTPPLIYTKVALSFLAIYNTPYARNLSVYLENTLPEP